MAGILSTRRGHVGWVTIDRHERRNALDLDSRLALREALAAFDDDPEVRVVVLTGAGSAFCAGTDLSGPQPPDHPLVRTPERLSQPLDNFGKPLIAAINGAAAGGGFELALACDIRVATTHAVFLLPEVRIGSLPGSGGTQRIFSALPAAIAWKALYTGWPIDADTALRYGLVTDLVAPDELVASTTTIAERVADGAPLSLRAARRAGRAALDSGAAHALERELWTELAGTFDRSEGRAAFREKRHPRFEGR